MTLPLSRICYNEVVPLPATYRTDRLFDTGPPTPTECRAVAADNAAAQGTLFTVDGPTEPTACPHTDPFPEETLP